MAHACTVCSSSTATEVRARLFDGHFLRTLLLVGMPFPVFAMAAGLVYLRMPELPEAEIEQ